MNHYEIHGSVLFGKTEPNLWFIRDTRNGELVRVMRQGTPGRLRSFKKKVDAQKAIDKLNKESQ